MPLEKNERIKIIEDYSVVMEELVGKNSMVIYNESNLPYPKSVIKNAILFQLREYSYEFWQKNAKEIYESLLVGLFTLVWFQPDISDWELRIPDVNKDDLSKLDKERKMLFINYIDTIIKELKQTTETLHRLGIQMESKGNVDVVNTGIVIALYLAKKKLEKQI
jgi:hypothetical protein